MPCGQMIVYVIISYHLKYHLHKAKNVLNSNVMYC